MDYRGIANFQKSAAVLADYGFNCIKLNDDWQGADFLAYHKDGDQTPRVQLKGRATIDKKYLGRDLYMNFPVHGNWYPVLHDELVELVKINTNWLNTRSWNDNGRYSSAHPSSRLLNGLRSFLIGT